MIIQQRNIALKLCVRARVCVNYLEESPLLASIGNLSHCLGPLFACAIDLREINHWNCHGSKRSNEPNTKSEEESVMSGRFALVSLLVLLLL